MATSDMNETPLAQTPEANRVTIPEEKFAPEPEKTPDHKLEVPNYADNEDTVKRVLGYVRGYYEDFKSRGQYVKWMSNCDTNDEMIRAAVNRTQLNSDESKQKEGTRSKVKSATFYADMRAIVGGESAVMLGNEEDLPFHAEPLADAWGPLEDEGREMAEQKNAYFSYVMERDDMRPKIRKILWRLAKYGVLPVEMGWKYVKTWKKVKFPYGQYKAEVAESKKNKTEPPVLLSKRPSSGKDLVFYKALRVIADHPTLRWLDIKDCWFDTSIFDAQQQSCIVKRTQKQLGDIWRLQRTNEFKNVGKLTTALLYVGENAANAQTEDQLTARQTNAGETPDAGLPTTQFDVWYGWVRAPINDDTGKWEEDSQLPHWYEYVFVGDLKSQPLCVKLTPHWDDEIPFELLHCLDDDKGAISISYGELVKSYVAQESTAFDQFIDNATLINNAPWIMEPRAISKRSMTFGDGHNDIYIKKSGAPNPEILDIKPNGSVQIPMLQEIDDRRRKALGTNKPFMGEPLGSRTSASEAITDFEQSIKPALEDAKFKAYQLFPFIGKWIDRQAELFADPEQTIQVTYAEAQQEVKPAYLYGPMKYRVVSVKQFQDSVVRERMETQFLQTFLPIAMQTPGFKADVPLKQIAKNRNYENVDEWWQTGGEYDAEHVAQSENQAIVLDGIIDLPKPEENHDVHLRVHEPFLASVVLLSEDQKAVYGISDQNIQNFKLHIQQTKNLKQQGGQQQQAGLGVGTEQQPAEGQLPGTPGEVSGDLIGGEEPQAGRPPDVQGTGLLEGVA